MPLRSPLTLTGLCLLATLAGCASASTSNTARTATEQMLLSNAVDQSLDKIDFRPLQGQNVYLEEKYVDSVDKMYIIASIRHRVLRAGGMLVDKAESADLVLEPRSGGVGTTTSNSFVGSPSIVLPGMMTIPEVKLITKTQQAGFAKIGISAYDPKTRESRGEGGLTVAQSSDNNYFVLGVGPYKTGTLSQEITRTTTGAANQRVDQLPANVAFSAGPRKFTEEPGKAMINTNVELEQIQGTVPAVP